MPETPRLSPAAYIAHITAFDCQAPEIRKVRLSARQVDALAGREVPVPIDGTSPLTPCEQAELVIQHAVARILQPRLVSVVLWRRDRDLGDVSVWHDGAFVPIASVELAPAQAVERAA
jgi:hypothetical protein